MQIQLLKYLLLVLSGDTVNSYSYLFVLPFFFFLILVMKMLNTFINSAVNEVHNFYILGMLGYCFCLFLEMDNMNIFVRSIPNENPLNFSFLFLQMVQVMWKMGEKYLMTMLVRTIFLLARRRRKVENGRKWVVRLLRGPLGGKEQETLKICSSTCLRKRRELKWVDFVYFLNLFFITFFEWSFLFIRSCSVSQKPV